MAVIKTFLIFALCSGVILLIMTFLVEVIGRFLTRNISGPNEKKEKKKE